MCQQPQSFNDTLFLFRRLKETSFLQLVCQLSITPKMHLPGGDKNRVRRCAVTRRGAAFLAVGERGQGLATVSKMFKAYAFIKIKTGQLRTASCSGACEVKSIEACINDSHAMRRDPAIFSLCGN